MFAERTNRIGRNVESFVQSRGGSLFSAGRRTTDDDNSLANNSIHRRSCNGDVVRHDYTRFFNPMEEEEEEEEEEANSRRSYGRRNRRVERTRSKGVYPSEEGMVVESSTCVLERGMEMRPRRGIDGGSWRADVSTSVLNGSTKPTMVGNGRIWNGSSSTLPRRGRTINFGDQPGSDRVESRRGYPRRSLQDLSDLSEVEERGRARDLGSRVAFGFVSSSGWRGGEARRGSSPYEDDGWHRRRGYGGRGMEDRLEDDDYLRLYRSLSRLSKYPQGGKYEPGQVHYERECRTFGKDTVAFIYYKTCYL
ncbi:hypothetical protein HZU67_04629 [Apis mellifera carnica]|nr:hypothetical protein HZU67_04629 [Apis mellifera carnica]